MFSINFSSYKSLKDTNIGIFNAPTSSFYNSSELEPLPTVDRGFFFSSTSYLYNTHLVPAPDFTLKIWVKVISPGIIFGISDGYLYYKLEAFNQKIYSNIRLCESSSDCPPVYKNYSTVPLLSRWYHILVINEFSYTGITQRIGLDNNSALVISWENVENSLGWYNKNFVTNIGHSFVGFIYSISLINGLDYEYLPFVNPPNCINNQYWDGGSCYNCNSSCSTWPWCVRGGDCSYCSNNLQTSCYGYLDSQYNGTYTNCGNPHCVECYNNVCTRANDTLFIMRLKFPNGSYFDSIDSYYLIDMLNTSVSYYLQSGANDTTDYFNSPDADDYVPVALRGFYFNKGSLYIIDLYNIALETLNLKKYVYLIFYYLCKYL